MTLLVDQSFRQGNTRLDIRYRLAHVLNRVSDWLFRQAAEHNRRRTAAMLEGLPFDVRKDIGWPAADVA